MAADFKNLFNTPDTTSEYEEKDIQDNKTMGILAYIWLLVLIPIFAAKESKFARFHANQGLVLLIAEFIVCGVLSILSIIPFVGIVFIVLNSLAGLCFLGLMILGIVNVVNGKAKELPLIGKFRILK
ncbi:MAG: DUF4870 domain-containing protein [Clostridia bacterium]|nr:DUF4870 domain-containing protein [Clostridia bacterium]